jgi:hypothetical protein
MTGRGRQRLGGLWQRSATRWVPARLKDVVRRVDRLNDASWDERRGSRGGCWGAAAAWRSAICSHIARGPSLLRWGGHHRAVREYKL